MSVQNFADKGGAIKKIAQILYVLAMLTMSACGHFQQKNVTANLYGVIEVGAKGVKGAVVQVSPADNEMQVQSKIEPYNVNAIDPNAITEVGEFINKMLIKMKEELSVPTENIYIVGSSAIAQATHKDKLTNLVKEKTGKVMDFVSTEQEISLIFKGIVPQKERKQVAMIDIGSGNTKGAYLVKDDTDNFATFEIPLGTKSFTKKIDEQRDSKKDFKGIASGLGKKILVPQLKAIKEKQPALQNLNQVYLSGGIVWAMVSTVIYPKEQEKYVTVTAEDIAKFYERATGNSQLLLNPDLSSIQDSAQRQKTEAEIKKVGQVFTPKEIVAGAEILKSLSDELNFKSKKIFFAREGLHAWSLGYIEDRLKK